MVAATSFGFVIARMRLETGSIWPAIALHGACNNFIQAAFDPATTGTDARATLWVGEAGILAALVLIIAAVVFSRGHWTSRRVPEVPQGTVATKPCTLSFRQRESLNT
jgi:membrane protease YdiL (CAAX protease family)